MSTMFRLCFLLLLTTCLSTTPTPALSEDCNPQDKKTLLQIKADLGNPTDLSSWDPTTDCCNANWFGVRCGVTANRIDILNLVDLNLPKPSHIPSSIGNLPYLNMLVIEQVTNLTGPIPPTITNLTQLQSLTITHTKVSGVIPHFLAQIKPLYSIDLSHNKFTGQIPSSLSVLSSLQRISFDGNKLSGSIPESYGFLKSLDFLTLSHNQFSGKIPASLGRLDLAIVDLSRNNFEGDASLLFGTKKLNNRIDLSRNSLAFDIGKVGFAKSISGLDLRYNQIYGSLPKGLTALKYLNSFNVSYNSLCGEIPKGGKLQKFGASAYIHNKCLCGSPLPSCKLS